MSFAAATVDTAGVLHEETGPFAVRGANLGNGDLEAVAAGTAGAASGIAHAFRVARTEARHCRQSCALVGADSATLASLLLAMEAVRGGRRRGGERLAVSGPEGRGACLDTEEGHCRLGEAGLAVVRVEEGAWGVHGELKACVEHLQRAAWSTETARAGHSGQAAGAATRAGSRLATGRLQERAGRHAGQAVGWGSAAAVSERHGATCEAA